MGDFADFQPNRLNATSAVLTALTLLAASPPRAKARFLTPPWADDTAAALAANAGGMAVMCEAQHMPSLQLIDRHGAASSRLSAAWAFLAAWALLSVMPRK
jgi:hypothetical protein